MTNLIRKLTTQSTTERLQNGSLETAFLIDLKSYITINRESGEIILVMEEFSYTLNHQSMSSLMTHFQLTDIMSHLQGENPHRVTHEPTP